MARDRTGGIRSVSQAQGNRFSRNYRSGPHRLVPRRPTRRYSARRDRPTSLAMGRLESPGTQRLFGAERPGSPAPPGGVRNDLRYRRHGRHARRCRAARQRGGAAADSTVRAAGASSWRTPSFSAGLGGTREHDDGMISSVAVRRFLPPLALIATLAQGCTGPAGSALVAQSPATSMRLSSPAGAPSFTVYTAGQTPGFPAGAAAEDVVAGSGGAMWFTIRVRRQSGGFRRGEPLPNFRTASPTARVPIRWWRLPTAISGSAITAG